MFCFIYEDLAVIPHTDPLYLQFKYAKRFDECYVLSIKTSNITDADGNPAYVRDKKIILRCTCSTLKDAIKILVSNGATLLETCNDIEAIENWHTQKLSGREVISIYAEELYTNPLCDELLAFLENHEQIFLKSKSKDFSCKIASSRLISRDDEVINFLKSLKYNHKNLLISPLLDIGEDSLGTKEARFFVMNDKLINASRPLHSIKHSVPKSLKTKAKEIITLLSEKPFPKNYVLDIAEFKTSTNTTPDIVEINPITTSMCYVNNSIFQEIEPSLLDIHKRLCIGAEYCLDATVHPERYPSERLTGANYEYHDTNRYEFL